MSIEEIRVCDRPKCGKYTRDAIKDGWITLGEGFIKYEGRNKDGQAKTEVYIEDDADFCSWECLQKSKEK